MPIHHSSPALAPRQSAGLSVFSEAFWKEWTQKEVMLWWWHPEMSQAEGGGRGRLVDNYLQAFSYSLGLHVHQQRRYPPPSAPTHQLPPQHGRFPMVLCLRGSPAVFLHTEAGAFPGSWFSRGVSVSVRFQPSRLDFGSHLLEWFPGDCSQPRGRGTHMVSRWELSLLRDLELLWWSHELWASSFSEKKRETEKGSGFP